ncbi:hypothetical protein Tsubulata_007862 [Turnera subulata]|uniref:CCHC-type domain-containing protein n=1 Tax=Turnera subulata TaxID=218843 RepID=A0A9Q0GEG3_9ROSI|nr:hypothetical protein Tsubulata_007862 [Turnera subulata]
MTTAPSAGGVPHPPDPVQETSTDVSMQHETQGQSGSDVQKSFKAALGSLPPSSGLEVDTELRIHKQWEDTVIVKMWGRSIGYKMLCSRLQRLWRLRGGFRVNNNYFLVKLADKEDYMHALTGGPWVVLDHYLTVEPWKPNFEPASHRVTSVVAWILVPGLSSELYQLAILKEIGNHVGQFIRVDYSTQKTERGRFAKAAVELDLSTPLQTKTCVDGVWYTIVYENLPQMCFECGRAGHDMSHCPSRLSTVSSPKTAAPKFIPVQQAGQSSVASPTDVSKDPILVRAGGSVGAKYGEWMLVSPRVRPAAKKSTNGPSKEPKESNKGQSSGSRFDVLAAGEEQGEGQVSYSASARLSEARVCSSTRSPSSSKVVVGEVTRAVEKVKSGQKQVAHKGVFIWDVEADHTAQDAPVYKRARGQHGYNLSGDDLAKAAVDASRKVPKPRKGKTKVGGGEEKFNVLHGVLAEALPTPVSFQLPVVGHVEGSSSLPHVPLDGGATAPSSSSMEVAFDLRGQGHSDTAVPSAPKEVADAAPVTEPASGGDMDDLDMGDSTMQVDA